jgi:hypothetical protein
MKPTMTQYDTAVRYGQFWLDNVLSAFFYVCDGHRERTSYKLTVHYQPFRAKSQRCSHNHVVDVCIARNRRKRMKCYSREAKAEGTLRIGGELAVRPSCRLLSSIL